MKNYLNYEKKPNNLSVQYYVNNVFKRIEFFILIILCISCIVFCSNHKSFNDRVSLFFVNISLPVVKTMQFPLTIANSITGFFDDLIRAKRENIVLRAENERLKALYIKALGIKEENEELKDLLKFVRTRSVKYKLVQLVTKPNQPYSSNIIINAGSDQGIVENSVITGKRAIIGRVVAVGKDKSRVLTLSDENSKIPVITSNSRARGILSGHNNNVMTINYLEKDHTVKKGDMVFTSGDDDHLPPGLLVGIVSKVNGTYVQVRAVENVENTNLAIITQY